MSSSIWTECGGVSELKPLSADPWRAVESQTQVSTRKLVDTDAEQAVLEELIDGVKPPVRTSLRLHYLLSTPFRYPPLRHGSRFGTRYERGIWYGSETVRTTFAEVAYYRLLFLAGSRAELGPVATQLTTFRVRVRTARGADLAVPPFDTHRQAIASPVSYAATQAMGAGMRADEVEAFRYPSARDVSGGLNVAVMDPAAFGRARPREFVNWHCTAKPERVEMRGRDWFERASFVYPREDFLVDGVLPSPAI